MTLAFTIIPIHDDNIDLNYEPVSFPPPLSFLLIPFPMSCCLLYMCLVAVVRAMLSELSIHVHVLSLATFSLFLLFLPSFLPFPLPRSLHVPLSLPPSLPPPPHPSLPPSLLPPPPSLPPSLLPPPPPSASPSPSPYPQKYVRAHFYYNPKTDEEIPCQPLGLGFEKSDILEISNQDDPDWWQVRTLLIVDVCTCIYMCVCVYVWICTCTSRPICCSQLRELWFIAFIMYNILLLLISPHHTHAKIALVVIFCTMFACV